jgi:hypothetical protein
MKNGATRGGSAGLILPVRVRTCAEDVDRTSEVSSRGTFKEGRRFKRGCHFLMSDNWHYAVVRREDSIPQPGQRARG